MKFTQMKGDSNVGILKKFALQFRKPEGLLGSIAGKLMASTGSEKNKWTISLLNIQQQDYVLEMGFGPGIAIELASKAIQDGYIVGIDYSDIMLQQAQNRNRESIRQGKVDLKLADVNDLPAFDHHFDKVFSVNSVIFWKEPIDTLKRVRQFMKPNGLIAITVQPYMKGATNETAKQFGNEIVHHLNDAGFSEIRMEFKAMKPVTAVCVLGVNK